MNSMHHGATYELLKTLFSEVDSQRLERFSNGLQSKNDSESLQEMWKYDKSLGGLGGYAMPAHTPINPFNSWGKDRNLFRSVQYAKAGFIYYPHLPRNMIVDAGRALEYTCKYVLDQNDIVSRLSNKMMLGKNIKTLYGKHLIDIKTYEACKLVAELVNIAKHEISEEEERTFSTLDGVVVYFAMRKIHNLLLASIDHHTIYTSYDIYDELRVSATEG